LLPGESLSLDNLQAKLSIDQAGHATIGGGFALQIPLPGAWQNVVLSVGADGSGPTVSVTLASPAVTVNLYPHVSGVDQLIGAVAASLLTDALDGLAEASSSTWKSTALDAATALGVYSAASGFDQDKLAQLVTDLTQGSATLTPATLVKAFGDFLARFVTASH
jgi:hypothetical protein